MNLIFTVLRLIFPNIQDNEDHAYVSSSLPLRTDLIISAYKFQDGEALCRTAITGLYFTTSLQGIRNVDKR